MKGMFFRIFDKLFCFEVKHRSDGVIFLSSAAKEWLEAEQLRVKNCAVIHPGVDIDTFQPLRSMYLQNLLSIPDDEPIVLSVGRLHATKGIDVVIQAFAKVFHRIKKGRLIIVGRGLLYSTLRDMSIRLGISDHVSFITKFIPPDEMPLIYASSDVFVSASYKEPFGLACCEAMACGLPLICSNVGGLKDMVENGVNGFLFNAGSCQALSRYMQALLVNDDLRKKMGFASREIAKRRFDYRLTAQKNLDFYKLTIRD
jgi:glycosyltransferase involved in cell wall biosynthesis